MKRIGPEMDLRGDMKERVWDGADGLAEVSSVILSPSFAGLTINQEC